MQLVRIKGNLGSLRCVCGSCLVSTPSPGYGTVLISLEPTSVFPSDYCVSQGAGLTPLFETGRTPGSEGWGETLGEVRVSLGKRPSKARAGVGAFEGTKERKIGDWG